LQSILKSSEPKTLSLDGRGTKGEGEIFEKLLAYPFSLRPELIPSPFEKEPVLSLAKEGIQGGFCIAQQPII
jgi:hypothetical protein